MTCVEQCGEKEEMEERASVRAPHPLSYKNGMYIFNGERNIFLAASLFSKKEDMGSTMKENGCRY